MPLEVTTGAGRIVVTLALSGLLVLSAPGRIVVVDPETAVAPPAPSLVTPPVASGLVRIGQLLTADDGVWSDATSWAYQWMRDGAPIAGATSATYTVVGADVRALITCEVTATGPGGTSAPEASNALASPWQPILALYPSAIIWDGQDPYCYGGAAVGAPVQYLYAVTGELLAEQSLTARQATRTSSGRLDFDGADDYYLGVPAHAALLQATCTYLVGADSVGSLSGEWCLHVLTTALVTSPYIWDLFGNTTNIARNQCRLNEAGTPMLGLLGTSQDRATIWRTGTPGYGAIYDLAGGVTLANSVTPASIVAKSFGFWTLGGNYNGSATWVADLRHLCFCGSELTAADLAVYRACAVAAGVM